MVSASNTSEPRLHSNLDIGRRQETVPSTVVDTVFLDIGGVLVVDVWEALLLTPDTGLAAKLNIDSDLARKAGTELWPRYATKPATERAFWRDLSTLLDAEIKPSLIEEVASALVRPDPQAQLLLEMLAAQKLRVGLISNNTAFWFERQSAVVDFAGLVDPELRFLSHEQGMQKGEGLYQLAANVVDPANALVIDDRTPNLSRAQSFGFHIAAYSMYSGRSNLVELVRHNLI